MLSARYLYNRIVITLLLFSLFAATGKAQNKAKLDEALKEFRESAELKYAGVSFQIKDVDNRELIGYNAEKSLIPASNLKLYTTAAALALLGDTFRFETKVGYAGKISSGILKGNICISGSGDPTLGSNRFGQDKNFQVLIDNWVLAVSAAGIKKVEGDIIADIGNYEINMLPDGWIWTDIGNYYGAGVSGLNINENFYRLIFSPGKNAGDDCKLLRCEPPMKNLSFINQMKTGNTGSGDNGYIYGGIFSQERYLSGSLPAGVSEFGIKGSIPDPAYFTGELFREKLMKAGISISGKVKVIQSLSGNQPVMQVLSVETSPVLSEIVKETNHESINLYAEALLKKLGSRFRNSGSTTAGIEVIYEWLGKNGITSGGVFITDGSGLSPTNAINAAAMTELLYKMKDISSFTGSLPIAGVSGTVSNFCKGGAGERRIIAKSGSFKKIIGFSGYIRTVENKLLPFSIIVNNYNCTGAVVRKKIEMLLTAAL